jgi:hypothetical protein
MMAMAAGCLAPPPSAGDRLSPVETRLLADGWKKIEPGVYRRDLKTGMEETSFGLPGLNRARARMRSEYDALLVRARAKPSPLLDRSLSQLGGGLAALDEAVLNAKEPQADVLADEDCGYGYDLYVNPRWIPGAMAADSSASFNNDCGYRAVVWTDALARTSDEEVYDQHDDYGENVAVSSSAVASGCGECFASARAWVLGDNINLFRQKYGEAYDCGCL